MLASGFVVYGANGPIGFYSSYNHEEPTVLITCRGATCGSINVCEPKSYVTGNAMALDDLDISRVDLNYLVAALRNADFSSVITGVAQPQITGQSLARFQIPLPPLAEQKRISAILDEADALRTKRREALAQLDALLQSTFLTLFGDPVTNPMGWPSEQIGNLGNVVTGKTPPSKENGMFGDEIPFATPSDLDHQLEYTARSITPAGAKFSKVVRKGSTLVCCIGTLGKMARTPNPTAFNQQINAVEWGREINDWFGLFALGFCKTQMIGNSSATTLPILNKSGFSKVEMLKPPLPLQQKFAAIVESVERQKAAQRAHLAELDALFAALQHRAFRGEL